MRNLKAPDQVTADRKTRNYLVQAGLEVTQSNCSQLKAANAFSFVNAVLILPVMVNLPEHAIPLHAVELACCYTIPGLLWYITRHIWPGFALGMRINLIGFGLFLPVIVATAVLQEASSRRIDRALGQNIPQHLVQHHSATLFILGLLGFLTAELAVCYFFSKKLNGLSLKEAKRKTALYWVAASTLLVYGATAWAVFYAMSAGFS